MYGRRVIGASRYRHRGEHTQHPNVGVGELGVDACSNEAVAYVCEGYREGVVNVEERCAVNRCYCALLLSYISFCVKSVTVLHGHHLDCRP